MFWRTQTKLKGTNPANGIVPNFSYVQKFLSDSNKFLSEFDNLDPGTEYTYRVFVETKDGYTYGDEQTFTTDEDLSFVECVGEAVEIEVAGYYDLQGLRHAEPQPGLNIVVYSDGSSKKICYRR